MPIVLVRIDDRLIHGQIVEGWLKPLSSTHIVVVSDEVARDKMQQILLSMAVSSHIKVTALSVDDAARRIREEQFEKERVLLLVSRPQDIVQLLERGVRFESVNVGGMHYSPGKKQLLRNLSVNDGDITALRTIALKGVRLEGRVLPSDDFVNISDVLEKDAKGDKQG